MKTKKGFFFSLITFFVILLLFFYFRSGQEAKKKEMELESERYTLIQYNDFIKDLKYMYVPTQIRLVTKMVLLNVSEMPGYTLYDIDINMTQAILEGKVSEVQVIDPNLTFFRSIENIHRNWLFLHTYNYTVHNYSVRQKDWQNISANYSISYVMNASGYRYSLDLNGSVTITSLGINTPLGLITPNWEENTTEPCTLRRLSTTYDCQGISGGSPT